MSEAASEASAGGSLAVVDASPLILLVASGRLALLRGIADRIVIPQAVHDEIHHGALNPTGLAVDAQGWIELVQVPVLPPGVTACRLDRGESEVLAFAFQNPGAVAVVDERKGRRCAARLGVPLAGTLAVIVAAKSAGTINAIRPVIDDLLACGLYVSPAMVARLLTDAGE